jgi:hypothetical protein
VCFQNLFSEACFAGSQMFQNEDAGKSGRLGAVYALRIGDNPRSVPNLKTLEVFLLAAKGSSFRWGN